LGRLAGQRLNRLVDCVGLGAWLRRRPKFVLDAETSQLWAKPTKTSTKSGKEGGVLPQNQHLL
jgi:hypothetical protein